jgi:hypothetical protein
VDPAGYCIVRLTSTEGNVRFLKAPVLYAARKAILIDLRLLKGAIEAQ